MPRDDVSRRSYGSPCSCWKFACKWITKQHKGARVCSAIQSSRFFKMIKGVPSWLKTHPFSLTQTFFVFSRIYFVRRWSLEGDQALKVGLDTCRLQLASSDGLDLQVEDMNPEAVSLIKAIEANPDPDASWRQRLDNGFVNFVVRYLFVFGNAEVLRPDFLLCGDTALFCYLARRHATFRDTPAQGCPEVTLQDEIVQLGKVLQWKSVEVSLQNLQGYICMAWSCCSMCHYPGGTRWFRTGSAETRMCIRV